MPLELLPLLLVGLLLAGIFDAIISIADSLIHSCSSMIIHDLLPHKLDNTLLLKLAITGITAVDLGLALMNNQSVFNMVIMAWHTHGPAGIYACIAVLKISKAGLVFKIEYIVCKSFAGWI